MHQIKKKHIDYLGRYRCQSVSILRNLNFSVSSPNKHDGIKTQQVNLFRLFAFVLFAYAVRINNTKNAIYTFVGELCSEAVYTRPTFVVVYVPFIFLHPVPISLMFSCVLFCILDAMLKTN